VPAEPLEIVAAVLFALALAHTFSAKQFARLAHHFPRHAGLLHLLGEVEVIFGFWAIVLVFTMAFMVGGERALEYAESRNYREPLFVFVVMVIAGSRPVLATVLAMVRTLAKLLPLSPRLAVAWLSLALVPLLGSLITEPAAMTISALVLGPRLFTTEVPERLKYLALGTLFVNISIGGTLSSYAAPPVLMVASTWQWDSLFMLSNFGCDPHSVDECRSSPRARAASTAATTACARRTSGVLGVMTSLSPSECSTRTSDLDL
jgi:hypothetical protein